MNPIEEFERLGEPEVRKRLANSVYGDPRNSNYLAAQAWLRSKERESEEARSSEIIFAVREANAVAREANDFARASNDLACTSNSIALEAKEFARLTSVSASKQARWAMWAAIIATVAIIIAAMTYIKTP